MKRADKGVGRKGGKGSGEEGRDERVTEKRLNRWMKKFGGQEIGEKEGIKGEKGEKRKMGFGDEEGLKE